MPRTDAEKSRSSASPEPQAAKLSSETIEEWTLRFFAERGMPAPSDEELHIILELGRNDELTGHQ
jgi:hypothetical protein